MNELREYIEACKNNMNYLAPGRVERYLDLEVARVRADALEEAAKECEWQDGARTGSEGVVDAQRCAQAIRALIPTPKGKR